MDRAGVTTLYQALLGGDYARLPPTLARLHAHEGRRRHAGTVVVRRGSSTLSRLYAWVTQLPPAGEGPILVDIAADADGETWTRHVAGHAMRSRLRAHAGRLRERIGPVTFDFELPLIDGQVTWTVDAVRVFGLSLPRAWFRDVLAREFELDGRYRFDVHAALPLAGLLVHYTGWLDVD